MSKLRNCAAVLLVCALIIGTGYFIGLRFPWQAIFQKQPQYADPSTYLDEFQNKWQYNCLDSDLRECYGTIYTAMTDNFDKDADIDLTNEVVSEGDTPQTAIGISIPLPKELDSREKAKELFNAVFLDNPQFFYVSNTFLIGGYTKGDQPHYNKIEFVYTMTADTRKQAQTKLENAVSAILKEVPQTDDEYDVEYYLHDKLVSNCTYDSDAADKGSAEFPNAYSAYGAIAEGKAVCEGYARGLQLLFDKTGIRGTLVRGESLENGEGHMWNMVSINGNPYHLDATWNDSKNNGRHNYFNVTTAQILLSHSIDEGQSGIVECTAIKDNYYHRNDLYVDSFSRSVIAQKIAEQIKRGETQVEFLFAKDKFENARLFLKSRQAVLEQIGPHLADSGYSLWSYSLYSYPEQHILRIVKK